MDLERKKLWLETIQAAVTIAAILVGGGWTFWVFVVQRETAPHAIVDLKTTVIRLTDEVNLMQVTLRIQNTGHRLIPSANATVRVQNILPIYGCSATEPCVARELNEALVHEDRTGTEFDWPQIAYAYNSTPNTIEPGETASIRFEFAIRTSVQEARIYGFVENSRESPHDGRARGWADTKFINFADPKSMQSDDSEPPEAAQ